ncbi:MAG TPA: S41 family peptidase [Gemmatimonadales bacterium]
MAVAVALVLGDTAALRAQAAAPDSARIERLAALGRLWVAVKYFHPWLAYRPIDWDAALVAAVPRVGAASDRAAYASAVRSMLDALGDPVTTLEPERGSGTPASPGEPDPRSWWTGDSVLVVSLRNATDLNDFNRAIERLGGIADTIRAARRVVFDLRAPASEATALEWVLAESGVCSLFTPTPIRAPDQRGRLHSGFVPENGTSSGGYYSGFYTVDGASVSGGESAAAARRAVILVNENSHVPEAMLALREAGRALIVADGSASEAGAVRTYRWRLPDSLHVSMRLTELLHAGEPDVSLADTVVSRAATGARDAALAAAVASFSRPPRGGRRGVPAWRAPGAPTRRAAAGAEAAYPALPYRLMAAFKIWAVGQYFFPYRHLTGERWDQVLTRSLARLEGARDSLEYGLAVAEMATHLHDTHVRVTSPALREHFGTARAPVFIRVIEGQPVITHFTDDSAARAAGARVGDIVVAVDGEDARARMRRLERHISASTPQSLHAIAALRLTAGRAGSQVRLRVRGAGDVERTVTMTRVEAWELTGRSGPLFQVLPGNIGYADLGRLPASQVDSMFERLKGTRAIVFDMRGYPLGTAWSVAPRLTTVESPPAARFSRPNAMTPDTTERTEFRFMQQLPPTDQWRYLRPTVMLIDERTVSQAEHTGLFLRAANGTRFIGSPTTGANGDVTVVLLPGGLQMSFSGHAVRHVDGQQLQRRGLVPDVPVRPTIAGLRSGRDEVLEAAVQYLERKKQTPTSD